jgi:hypothetical protein
VEHLSPHRVSRVAQWKRVIIILIVITVSTVVVTFAFLAQPAVGEARQQPICLAEGRQGDEEERPAGRSCRCKQKRFKKRQGSHNATAAIGKRSVGRGIRSGSDSDIGSDSDSSTGDRVPADGEEHTSVVW